MISKLMLLEQKTLKQLIKNKSNVNVNKVKDILQLDPTLNVEMISDDTELGKYGEWLLGKLYKKYDQLTNEEKNTIKSDLQFYDYQTRSKRIPSEYDNIYKIKSIKELNDIVKKLQDNNNPLTQDPVTVAIGNHKFKTVFENPFELLKRQYYGDIKEGGVTKWLVFNPKTKEESIVAGHDTKWCTSRDDSKNQWDRYIYEGNTAWIFLLSDKYKTANPEKYSELVNEKLDKICIIVENGQCQTRDNRLFELKKLPEIGGFIEDRIDTYEIKLENHDILLPTYRDGINQILRGIKNKDNRLVLMFKMTKEKQINQLKNGIMDQYKVIQELEKNNIEIDQDIQIQLVLQDYLQLKYITDRGIPLTNDVQLQQVSKNGLQIKYIIDAGIIPNYDIQLQQVRNRGNQIKHIIDAGVQPEDENEWHEIQLQQVTNRGYQIRHIINAGIIPHHDIQLQQVTKIGTQLQYITDANIKPIEHDVQLQQVSQNGHQIQYLIDAGIKPDGDIQLQQVMQDGQQIYYIINAGVQPENENEWHEIQLQQVTNCGEQIRHIINTGIIPDYDIQLQQVKQNGYQIQYIIDAGIKIDYDIQLQQVKQDGYQIHYIISPDKDVQLQQIKQNPDQYKHIKNPTPEQTQLYKQLKGIKESTQHILKLLDVN